MSLIGSSLGGYYAIYLAEKYQLKAVLINPAVPSHKTLKKAVDTTALAPNYYDDTRFEWQLSHLDMLKSYAVEDIISDRYLLMLQKADDVLDYRDAMAKLPEVSMIIEDGGTHAFDGVERYFNRILTFLHKYD